MKGTITGIVISPGQKAIICHHKKILEYISPSNLMKIKQQSNKNFIKVSWVSSLK